MNINYLDAYEEIFLKQTDPLYLFPMSLSKHYTDQVYNLLVKKITRILELKALGKQIYSYENFIRSSNIL